MKLRKLKVVKLGLLYLKLSLQVIHILKTKRRRRFKVRPINRRRNTEGAYFSLVKGMRTIEYDCEQFLKYTRMVPCLFQKLVSLVGPVIKKDETKKPLSPEHRLMMTLHYLAEGCSMQEIAWNFRVGKATVHVIIKETCEAIWNTLAPKYLKPPEDSEWRKIAQDFCTVWEMPLCIGAVDGKHITIQAPSKSGSEFFNYKKTFSLVLMAVCDANYKFILIDIGAEGANHDSVVFRRSGFGQALMNNELGIPPPEDLPLSDVKMPFFVVADSAFPLHTNIMRPYPGNNLGITKNIFNYRLSRARRTIENAFGILTQRWRILRKPIIANVENCERIVQSTVVLHNFIKSSEINLPINQKKYCPLGLGDYIYENGTLHSGSWRNDLFKLRSVAKVGSNNYSQKIAGNRDVLAEYFISPQAALPWQENYVLRGCVPNDL